MIYVIEKGYYSDRHPVYATTNYVAAKTFVDKVNDKSLRIHEFEDYVPETSRSIEKYVWHINFDAKTLSERYAICECTAMDFLCDSNWYCDIISKENLKSFATNGYCIEYSDANQNGNWHIYINSEQDDCYDKETEQRFFKIAKDYLMMYLAEKEGIN